MIYTNFFHRGILGLFLIMILAGSNGVENAVAQEVLHVPVGQKTTFTQFNYHYAFFADDESLPPPEQRNVYSEGTIAHSSVLADPGTGSEVYAEIGIVFELDLTGLSPDDVKQMPVSISFDYSYELNASWQSGRNVAIAAIEIPDFREGSVARVGYPNDNGTLENSEVVTFTHWPYDAARLTAGDFMNPEQVLFLTAYARALAPGNAGACSADSYVTLNSITFDFPQGTTTTTTIPDNNTAPTTTTTIMPEELTADFVGKPQMGKAPLMVKFFPQVSGNAVDGFWDFGDEETSEEHYPEHIYHQPGTYTVTLTVVSDTGDEFQVVKTDYITVVESQLMADFYALPEAGAPPLQVAFEDASRGPVVAWDWDFGDGNISTEQHPVHTYAEMGEYTVRLMVTDNNGNFDIKEIVNLIVVNDNILEADFAASPLKGPAPLTVQFQDSSSGNVVEWAWNFGDGRYSKEQNPTHIYDAPGTYFVGMRVSDGERTATEIKEGYIAVSPGSDRQYSLSGTVTGLNTMDVHVFLSGDEERITKADQEGAYSFQGLSSGAYVVTPYAEGVAFDVPSKEVAIANQSVGGVDFNARSSGPVIVSVFAEPHKVPADDETPVTFFAQVDHPSGLDSIARVAMDLESIGGKPEQDMFDDGTNGDDVAGDGVYAYQTTVAAETPPGPKGVFVGVVDTAGMFNYEVIEMGTSRSFSGTVGQNGTQKKTVQNEIEGQTLVTSYGLGGGGAAGGIASAAEAGSVLLQLFTPDNEAYFDSPLAVSSQTAEIQVKDASKGTWTFEIQNKGTQSQQYSLSVATSGTGVISGAVLDAETGQGIDDGVVTTTGGGSTVTQEGYYALLHPAGVFTVQAYSQSGTYLTASKSVTVSSGASQEVNLALQSTSSTDNGTRPCVLARFFNRPGDAALLDSMRGVRDGLLKKTSRGREYTALYYRYSPEVALIVQQNSRLRSMIKACAFDMLMLLSSVHSGKTLCLSANQVKKISVCLEMIKSEASPELQTELSSILQRVQEGRLF